MVCARAFVLAISDHNTLMIIFTLCVRSVWVSSPRQKYSQAIHVRKFAGIINRSYLLNGVSVGIFSFDEIASLA